MVGSEDARTAVRSALARHEPRSIPDILPAEQRIDTAVLVPLQLQDDPFVTMVVRSRALRHHSGEVSFPGGKPEPTDSDLMSTARREAEEEIGLKGDQVEIVGRLSAVPVATSRYRIHPFVGLIAADFAPTPDPAEVTRVLQLSMRDLVDGTYEYRAVRVQWAGAEILAPFFALDEETLLYGASAVVLVELMTVLGPSLGLALPAPREVEQEAPWLRSRRSC